MRVKVIDHRLDRRVISFLSAHPGSSIYHHPSWLNALQAETGQKCLMLGCERADGSLCGVMPLAYTRGLPFNIAHHYTKQRISSLPRTPFAGPISADVEATRLMLAEAIKLVGTEDIQLQIKTNEPIPEGLNDKLVAVAWRPTYVLKLPQTPSHLTFGNAQTRHKLKWGVTKARKLGLYVRSAESETDLEAWYSLYLMVMRRNCVPPRSFQLFLSLWRELRQSGLIKLLLAERISKADSSPTLLAGSIFLMTGNVVVYAFTGSSTRHLATHANDLILWEAIHKASEEGYRSFDFGEVPEEHPELLRFKTKWGAVPRPQFRYCWPHSDLGAATKNGFSLPQAAIKAWQYVPLSITARIGEWLYEYL